MWTFSPVISSAFMWVTIYQNGPDTPLLFLDSLTNPVYSDRMESPNRSLLTSAEAADLLGVERRTLIRMEDNGALESIRPYPRAQRRYRRADIEAIVGGVA